MQNSLNLAHKIPDTLCQAQQMCKDLLDIIDKNNTSHKEQLNFIKQQYKIALMQLRPGLVTSEQIALIFDEAEITTDPVVETEVEGSEKDEPKSQKKKDRKKKRKAIPDHLPRTVIEHDIAAKEKTCAKDQTTLSQVGYDVKEELKYTPAKFEVIEHRYPKYACQSCREGIVRARGEASLIPESYVSTSLLAHIAVSKFCNHLPLYRLEQMFNREGMNITRQVMASWMIKLGEALRPLVGIMHEAILESEVVSADETPVKLLTKDGVRTSKQCYMWQLSRFGQHPLIIFEYDQTRSKEVAQRLFGNYEGYVQLDAYAGYDVLFDEKSKRKRVGCLAHIFRKFKDFWQSLDKDKRSGHPARLIMGMIDDIYDIEEPLEELSPEKRLSKRKESKASEMFDKLETFIGTEHDVVATSSPYYSALRYALNELPLVRRCYFEHGMVMLDNNEAENAIRPFALGRRNWLFICSEQGAQASANIYSLLITAKANNIEPYSYLEKVIARLPHCRTVGDYEALLPA